MRKRDVLTLAVLLGLPIGPAPSLGDGDPARAVAIVCHIDGTATLQHGAAVPAEPLALFERLRPGTVVLTAAEAEVTLVFFDGRRYLVEAASRAVVEVDRLRLDEGSSRTLEPVPVVAEIAPIAWSENPGRRPGAGRIREAGWSVTHPVTLYPGDGTSVRADRATLYFALAGEGEVEIYRVEIRDSAGEAVFTVETEATRVDVPPGTLRPRASYYWRVGAFAAGRPTLRRDALFVTLGEEQASARQRLAAAAAASREDPALRLLLADFDRRLGLRREACLGLASASAVDPGNRAIERLRLDLACGEHQGPATTLDGYGPVTSPTGDASEDSAANAGSAR